MQKVVTDISKINIDRIDTVSPHYVWIDVDGGQVSQICRDFRTAMNFINGWQARWDKQVRRTRHYDDEDPDFDDDYSPWRKLTRTGKPPQTLKRIEVKILLAECTQEERNKAEIMLGA